MKKTTRAAADRSTGTAQPGSAADDRAEPVRTGRKRDHSRDGAILDAAIEVLGDVGYAAMTMDAVALKARAGKATVYRRWSSKEEMALEAVARLKLRQIPMSTLPDTGSLRADLLALFQPESAAEIERRDRTAAGLVSMVSHNPAFADAVHRALADPWAEAHLTLMRRAVERGEVAGSVDIETLSTVLPTMAAYRTLVQRKAFDGDFLLAIVDGVLMPALLSRAAPDASAR
ncbi:TetR/AcrR family transcriptional regulator [Longimicrobium terrae]|uniref:AcrR family transcriptional regulator n=1 Tax=Longimicrobium terrae TaxID=1639882 RepID=A0A841H7U2_9BACT|nr:TetR/AcrR family transcriptional regulator [Longimicrobium terrae]MBB4639657.1 AcrR family transcriptional regulator [Longimicrobium terrae]MBB6074058.1 AcrR family transcriptional regulator [Longimicrobium terrae]NNC32653.1 TetR/AcrR family transcriptional regulator [Longimicrobium terrae]